MDSTREHISNTPREVDLFAEETMEEILDTIDSLRTQIEQLQIHCEKLALDKAKVDQSLIDKELECQEVKEGLQKELAYLRKINLHLVASQNTAPGGCLDQTTSTSTSANWITSDAEKTYAEKVEAESKLEVLQLSVLEKDKYISSLEWQLTDVEATLTSVQAERDALALELECALAREHEDLQELGAVGDIASGDPRKHSDCGLVKSEYADDIYIRRVRKQPRRHLSDLTKRGNSYVEDFGGLFAGNASLSDYDVPASTEKEIFGLGRLKRSSNFSNINDLDEYEQFDNQRNQSLISDTGKQSWENFDEAHEDLSQLHKKRWDGFDDCDQECTVNHSDDMWKFTPDSIINVSTGEALSSLPEINTSLKIDGNESDQLKDQQVPSHKREVSEGGNVQRSESVSGKPLLASSARHHLAVHQKTNSEPILGDIATLQQNDKKMSSDKGITSKLEEYQKWKVSGCKGEPPAKLKISQC